MRQSRLGYFITLGIIFTIYTGVLVWSENYLLSLAIGLLSIDPLATWGADFDFRRDRKRNAL